MCANVFGPSSVESSIDISPDHVQGVQNVLSRFICIVSSADSWICRLQPKITSALLCFALLACLLAFLCVCVCVC